MLAGNIADFARSVRTFSDPAPALSGNQGRLDKESDLDESWGGSFGFAILRASIP